MFCDSDQNASSQANTAKQYLLSKSQMAPASPTPQFPLPGGAGYKTIGAGYKTEGLGGCQGWLPDGNTGNTVRLFTSQEWWKGCERIRPKDYWEFLASYIAGTRREREVKTGYNMGILGGA